MNHADTIASETPMALLECLLRGLGLLSRQSDRPLSPAAIRAAGPVPAQLGEIAGFQRMAEKLGYRIAVTSPDEAALIELPTPFFILPSADRPPLLINERRGDSLFGHDLRNGEPRSFDRETLRQSPITALLIRQVTATEQGGDWRERVAGRIKGVFWELAGASLFINLFALITPIVMMVIYNKVVGQSALTTLDVLALALVLVYGFDTALRLVRNYIASHVGARLEALLGGEAVAHLLALPYRHFETTTSGLITERIRQLDVIRNFFTGQMPLTLVDLVFVPLFMTVLFVIAPPLAWVALAAMPLLVGLSFLFHRPQQRRQEQQFNHQSARASTLNEIVHNALTVKSLGLENELESRWNRQLGLSVWAGFRSTHLANSLGVLSMTAQSLAALATVYIGARMIIAGELSFGALIAANLLSSRALAPMRQMVSAWHQGQEVRAAFARLATLLCEPAEEHAASHLGQAPIQGDIRFEQVAYRYNQAGSRILEEIDLQVEQGEFLGIVGPSGCGKSTFAKLLQGLYRPEAGRILIDGSDIRHLPRSVLRREIGVVPQEIQLFAGTLRDNIALGATAKDPARVIATAKFVGAHEFIQRLPEGYDTLLGEGGQGLSAGQRQLVAIARALMRDPRILILDEATSALDPRTEERLMQRLVQAHQGRTLIMVSHRLAPLRLADRVALIGDGRVAQLGPPDEIIAQRRPVDADVKQTVTENDLEEAA